MDATSRVALLLGQSIIARENMADHVSALQSEIARLRAEAVRVSAVSIPEDEGDGMRSKT